MPPGAVSSRPGLACAAPVNAPRSWPNSSLSSSDCDSAAQLMATSGLRGARRRGVDGARQDLLADAGLAQDQHVDVAGGGAFGERLHADACPRRRRQRDRPSPRRRSVGLRRGRARARPRARAAPPRAGRRRDSWRRRRAPRARPGARSARTPRPVIARRFAGEPGQSSSYSPGPKRPTMSIGAQRRRATSGRRVRCRRHARDGERPSGRLGARALPLDASLELGVRQRQAPALAPACSVRLGCTIRTSEPIAIASPGSTRTRARRRQLAAVHARAVGAAEVFDLDVVAECKRRWRRDAFASSSFTSTAAPPPRPTVTSPRAGSANVANCFGPMTSR